MAISVNQAQGAASARSQRFHLGPMLRLTLFLSLLHGYIGWRIVPDLALGTSATVFMVAWLVGSVCTMPLAFIARRVREQPLSDRLTWAGLIAAGSFSSLLVLTVLRDVVLLLAHALAAIAPEDVQLDQLAHVTAIAVPLLTIVLTVVGFVNARRRARVRPVEIAIPDLPPQLHGFSIAQITDIHVGPTIKGKYLESIVDAVNELDADMIAVTGDLVDGSVRELAPHMQSLARLRARHGAYFVTGNHEYYSGAHAWIGELRRLGLRVLMNEHVVLQHDGASVVIAGVTDYSAHHFDATHRSDPGKAMAGAAEQARLKLLLAHQPRSAF